MSRIVQKITKIVSKEGEWDVLVCSWCFTVVLGEMLKPVLSICATLCEKHDCFDDATAAFLKGESRTRSR